MKKLIAATLTGAFMQAPAHAQTLDSLMGNIDFSFGGYGTIGTVRTNTNDAQLTRGTENTGAGKSFYFGTDSNLGVQVTARFTPWLSVTVQSLEDSDVLTDLINWAYVKIEPLDSLSIKVGRVEIPLFAISESRDINYANVWLRPPNEVYAMANIEELDGAQVTYSLPIGSTHLSLTGYTGNSVLAISEDVQYKTRDVRGGEVRWETPWATVRGSLTATNVEIQPGPKDVYTFEGVGVLMDRNHIVAQAEFVRRLSAHYASLSNANGWYVFGGYRVGTFVPYASYAATNKTKPYDNTISVSGDQSTVALGVRWDAFKSGDLKFQIERVDPRGSLGIDFANEVPTFGHNDVTAFSATLDFVF
jgi:hypothetical protein